MNRGENIPLWAIFEMFYMGQLATYFKCLNTSTRINYEEDEFV
ncbi:MAG: Abi family protein [Kandleria sp.]|nr:Abi family protein [Kandleria sp.]